MTRVAPKTEIELRIVADPEMMGTAVKIGLRELERFSDYDRIGWGWSFNVSPPSLPRFFVRRISNGLSVRQIKEPDQ